MAKDLTRTTVRLGRELTGTIDETVAESNGEFRDRSHLLNVALRKFLDEHCDAEGNPLQEGEIRADGTIDIRLPPATRKVIQTYADAHGMSYASALSYFTTKAVVEYCEKTQDNQGKGG